jgi:dTDP-4-dehydrorhamnose 3,5-epimerase
VSAGTPWTTTGIEGVLVRRAVAHADERGSFSELWRRSWGPADELFVQTNLSLSKAGVLRGMHFHRRQSDLWMVVGGEALAAAADLRGMLDGSAARPVVETHPLLAGDVILIPPLVAHGFLAVSDLALVYLVTNEYDAGDELGFAWDDPDAAIPWPSTDPILSGRDRANPSVRDAVAPLLGEGR